MLTIEKIISLLNKFWGTQGCVILQPLDTEVGAGTFHPATFLKALGTDLWKTAYVQPTKRPQDSRFGKHPNKIQNFHQYQVLLKPPTFNTLDLYLKSLNILGLKPNNKDIKFIEDNWKSPTLAAWGIGWEVRINGLEVSQITYFQNIGGIRCSPISVELTYGIERLALVLQKKNTVKKLLWKENDVYNITHSYATLFKNYEYEMSVYNKDKYNTNNITLQMNNLTSECKYLLEKNLIYPALDITTKLSHLYNLIEIKKNIPLDIRQKIILQIRFFAIRIAELYIKKQNKHK
jgi:glycyl-tRNA synthetase alpha chain